YRGRQIGCLEAGTGYHDPCRIQVLHVGHKRTPESIAFVWIGTRREIVRALVDQERVLHRVTPCHCIDDRAAMISTLSASGHVFPELRRRWSTQPPLPRLGVTPHQ